MKLQQKIIEIADHYCLRDTDVAFYCGLSLAKYTRYKRKGLGVPDTSAKIGAGIERILQNPPNCPFYRVTREQSYIGGVLSEYIYVAAKSASDAKKKAFKAGWKFKGAIKVTDPELLVQLNLEHQKKFKIEW